MFLKECRLKTTIRLLSLIFIMFAAFSCSKVQKEVAISSVFVYHTVSAAVPHITTAVGQGNYL